MLCQRYKAHDQLIRVMNPHPFTLTIILRMCHFIQVSWECKDLDLYCNVKCRIDAVSSKTKVYFCGDSVNIKLGQSMVRCYVWASVPYGMETWTLQATAVRPLETSLKVQILQITWINISRPPTQKYSKIACSEKTAKHIKCIKIT